MSRQARILILTNGHLARNPRVLKEASCLGAAGHAVTVLGVRNHRPSVPLDAGLTARAACFQLEQIQMLDGPRAWLRRARVRLARELAGRGGRPSIHALGPASALLRAARAHPADLIIAHNEIAHWCGLRLLDAGRVVAADIEDWHSEDLLPADRAGRPLELLRKIEEGLLHRAAGVTTTSEALSSALHARYGGRRPEVLTNSFALPAPRSPDSATDGEPPAFFWFSQTTGPGRGLEEFLAAWSLCKRPSRLVLLGEVREAYAEHLRSLAAPERRHFIRFLPLVAPDELPSLIARHDIGLALEKAEIPNRDLTITNKILQYLGSSLAVVATPTAGQREVLAGDPDAGLLESFSSPTEAARALDSLIADPAALARRRAAARRLAEERYCWEREAPRHVARIERLLGLSRDAQAT